MNRSIIILVAVSVAAGLLAALAVIGTSTFATSASAQTTTAENTTALETRIQITKYATNSYTISEGSARVGSFDTIYAITGSVVDIRGNSDLITSTIQGDFNASSTMGYVMAQAANNTASSNSTQTTTTALPNPFAGGEEISQRIADEIQKGIEAAERSDERYAEIRCHFGMELPGFECRFLPLLDQVQ